MGLAVLGGLFVCAHLAWRTLPSLGNTAASVEATERMVASAPRTLVVAAHPDDIEWYLGGTVARLTAASTKVTFVIATNGEGGRGPQPGLGEQRRAEQQEAARRLGVNDLVFLGLRDGGLRWAGGLLSMIAAVWQEVRPELVFSFDAALPRAPYVHPDHQAIGRAVRDIHASSVGRTATVLLFHSRRPDTLVDIGDVMDQKLHALAAHESQGPGWAFKTLRSTGSQLARPAGLAYAEAFRRLQPETNRQRAGS